jgi:hypothetical protein
VDIRVSNNRASVNNTNDGGQAIWSSAPLGAHQGAAYTFVSTPPDDSVLILKASGGTLATPTHFIRVRYDNNGGQGRVRVYTTSNSGNNFTQSGVNLTAPALLNGDILSATADATGLVRVWRNEVYLGSAQLPNVASWTSAGGYIGMKFGSSAARVDNFSGGTLP